MRNAVVTEQAPKPVGPYSQAIVEGDFIFVAGQGPINPLTNTLELGDARSETKRVFENLRAILQAAGASLADVVKCNVYLRDINDFAAMNEVYATYFVVVEWAALIFAVGAVFVLRRKLAERPRPFRTPAYPWVPLFFVLGTVIGVSAIVWGQIQVGNFSPVYGLAIAVAGFPVHYLWKRLQRSL